MAWISCLAIHFLTQKAQLCTASPSIYGSRKEAKETYRILCLQGFVAVIPMSKFQKSDLFLVFCMSLEK